MNRRNFFKHFILLFIIEYSFADVYVYDLENKLIDQYDDEAATFGPSVSSDGLKGYLLTTNPSTACQPIAPAPTNITLPKDYKWIALIPRTQGNTSCDFDLKVFNAQNANFSAVIVYNYEDRIIEMGTRGRSVRIPSSMVSLSDGKALINRSLYNFSFPINSTQRFHIKLLPGDPFRIGPYFIPFAVVIAVMIFGLIILMLIRCLLQRRRTRRHRLPRSALKQLKTKKFVKGDRWEVCAICLDDYVDGAKLRILPCDHAYHMKCIDPWLLNSRRQCPVCKRYVFPQLEHSDEEANSTNQTQRPTQSSMNDERTPLLQSTTQDNEINATTIVSLNQTANTSDDDDPFTRVTTNRMRQVFLPRRSTASNETSSTTYGTGQEISTNGRSANFFVGSISGATDNTNASAQSVTDEPSDIETIDDDDDDESEQMHSVVASTESNPAYVDDEESS